MDHRQKESLAIVQFENVTLMVDERMKWEKVSE